MQIADRYRDADTDTYWKVVVVDCGCGFDQPAHLASQCSQYIYSQPAS